MKVYPFEYRGPEDTASRIEDAYKLLVALECNGVWRPRGETVGREPTADDIRDCYQRLEFLLEE